MQASFLSLNLNALAEHLAKVDLSQRLFVEADLLPSESVIYVNTYHLLHRIDPCLEKSSIQHLLSKFAITLQQS